MVDIMADSFASISSIEEMELLPRERQDNTQQTGRCMARDILGASLCVRASAFDFTRL